MALIDTLKEKFGADFHPALLLGEVVHNVDNDIKLRVDCAKTLLPYCESSLKSVELRGSVDHNFGLLRITMFGEDEEDDAIDGEFEELEEITL